MIVDCHVHPDWDWPAIAAAAKRHRIDRLCLFSIASQPLEGEKAGEPWNPPPKRVCRANDHVARLLAANPGNTYGFCFLNPRDPVFFREELVRCIAEGPFIGIKLWISCKATDPRVGEVAELAGKHGVPVLLHCWNKTTGNLIHESDSRDIAALAREHPETRLIAAHLTGIGERGLADLAPLPNVLVDTSGGEPETGILELALKELGAERILYGSDAPIRDFGSALGRVLDCRMTAEERMAILGGNFLRQIARKTEVAHVV